MGSLFFWHWNDLRGICYLLLSKICIPSVANNAICNLQIFNRIFFLFSVHDASSLIMRSDSRSWCSECGYASPKECDVIRHIEAKHLHLQIHCRLCPTILKTRLYLKRHLRNKHLGNLKDPLQIKAHIEDLMTYHFNWKGIKENSYVSRYIHLTG